MKRKNSNDSWHYSNDCTVKIGKVESVTGPDAVCTNETATFTVDTDPDDYFDGVVWKIDGVQEKIGGETLEKSWSTVGKRTITASMGNSSASKSIDVINALSVVPSEAYVAADGTKAFSAYICSSGTAVEVTSGNPAPVFTSSNGTFNGNTLTASSTASSSKGADWVKVTYNNETTDADHDCDLTVFKCNVTSADITTDEIIINLIPAGLTGGFELELDDPDNHTIREEGSRASGNHTDTFDIPNLAEGEYEKVKGKWTIKGSTSTGEYDYHIRVLGIYRHSVYNLANEACHSGATESYCYTTGDCTNSPCNWNTGASGISSFLAAVDLNGSGYSTSLGYITTEEWCQNNGYPAPSECTGYLMRDLSITGGCPQCPSPDDYMIANETVAINPSHPYLGCGDEVYVHTIGNVTVTDHGGGLIERQLDHYVGLDDCNTPVDKGNFMTVKIFE